MINAQHAIETYEKNVYKNGAQVQQQDIRIQHLKSVLYLPFNFFKIYSILYNGSS